MIISIGIIALNEESYLPSLLNDILSQTFPLSSIDFILIDSLSSDGTKNIMESFREKYKEKFHDIRIYENVGKWQSNGWNIFIDNSIGKVLIRIDAHAHIPNDFIKKVIDTIETEHLDVLGGKRPTILQEKTNWSEILLEAENSLFGSGIAVFRTSDKARYVKSVFHGAYRREVFEKAGKFNERLRRTEDNEIHWRIRKNGFSIRYDPSIISYQYARPTLRKMMKQKFSNGVWIGKTFWICPQCLSLYHFVPGGFVGALIVTTILSFFTFIPLFLLLGLYGTFCLINTLLSVVKNKKLAQMILIILFPLLHISYGVGTILGLLSLKK